MGPKRELQLFAVDRDISAPPLFRPNARVQSQAKRALDKAITHARAKAAAASGTTATPLVPWTLHDLPRTVATGCVLARGSK
jgi:hypothetical protein